VFPGSVGYLRLEVHVALAAFLAEGQQHQYWYPAAFIQMLRSGLGWKNLSCSEILEHDRPLLLWMP
jgi:hypothetical protein